MDRISVADSPAAPKTVAGRFGAARNGDIYATTLLPKLAPGDLNFDPSEVQVIRPTGKANGAAAIQVDVEFFLCECIRATWCTLTRSLNATILDPSGQPVVGASVTFIANDTEVGTDITDNMGRANASVFSEDFQWKARVSAHSYVPKVTELFEMTVQVITVTLARQQEVAVSGRVIEELKGRDVPVGGASLRLLQPRDRQVLYTSQTGSNGRFSFPAIAINEAYLLSVSKPGYITSETEVRFSQATNNLEVTLTRGSSTRFFDGDFSEVWLSSLLGPAGPARVNAERVAEGGNDGPYRAEWVTGIEKQATAAHMKASALWDPATGSISGISFSFDIMHVSGSPEAPPLTAYYLALRQGDDTFLRYAGDAIAGRWISVGGANLIPTDFIPLNGDTPPDFSLDGSPIQFGYAVIKDGREFSNRTGIDNWSVTVEH
jgi:hypothetical protein